MSEDITPKSIVAMLKSKDFSRALIMSLKLNESKLIRQVYETIPPESIALVVQTIASSYVERVLSFVVGQMDTSPHIEFHLKWIEAVLYQHSAVLQSRSPPVVSVLRSIQKTVGRKFEDISKICQFNRYTVQYILSMGGLYRKRAADVAQIDDSDEEMEMAVTNV